MSEKPLPLRPLSGIPPIPETLTRAGIVGVEDNLPPGAGVSFASAFVRIYRAQLEEKILGLKRVDVPLASPKP